MTAADWATVASLATALGTLVLAVATFSAVRSGNRTARAAELSLLTSRGRCSRLHLLLYLFHEL